MTLHSTNINNAILHYIIYLHATDTDNLFNMTTAKCVCGCVCVCVQVSLIKEIFDLNVK